MHRRFTSLFALAAALAISATAEMRLNIWAPATVGTVTSGTWQADTIAIGYGGTGATSITADTFWYASAADTLSESSITAFALSVLDDVDEATFKATVNLEAGTDFNAYDAELGALSGLTFADDKIILGTGAGTVGTADCTAFAQSILDDVDEATFKATVNLEAGTDVQAYDADLTTYAGITPSANVQTLLGAADFAAFKTSLSLNNVENTAVSTWAGSTNITTLGTIATCGGFTGTGVLDLGGATSVELPNAADPAVTVAGQFAQDTTDGALIGYDGTAERVYAHPVQQFSFTVLDDDDWASEVVPVWTAPKDMAVTIVQVHAVTMGTTPSLAYNIEERAKAGMASAGTDIYAADQAADATGEDETSFSNAGIAAGAHLVFTTAAAPETGTVDLIHVVVYYTKNVE